MSKENITTEGQINAQLIEKHVKRTKATYTDSHIQAYGKYIPNPGKLEPEGHINAKKLQ